jgi:uncharacterized protein YjeT (DUF2065 family)
MFLIVATLVLTVMGLSQVYHGQLWMAYYQALSTRGLIAMRAHGVVIAAAGAAVVSVHNVWSGPALVLTALGWLLLVEGAFCILVPQISLKAMLASAPELRRKSIVASGVVVLIIAGVLWAELLSPLFS